MIVRLVMAPPGESNARACPAIIRRDLRLVHVGGITDRLAWAGAGTHPAIVGDRAHLAPLVTFAITPRMVFEFDLCLTVGTSEEIRDAFQKLRRNAAATFDTQAL